MASLKIDHAKCTECRMCYVVCREIEINAVVVSPTSQHLLEIDERCTYPGCTVCLMYCPAEGSIVESDTGRSMVPPPPKSGPKIEDGCGSLEQSGKFELRERFLAGLEMTSKLRCHLERSERSFPT